MMFDFVEYVVAELKSKRLSKANAIDVFRQFSGRPTSVAAPSVIHPLLHRNTSDLNEQRYSTTFTGKEFFLADHQVKLDGQASQKVLPGVAYLEMARAAIEQALPDRPEGMGLELHSIVWSRPIVITENKEISIALLANDDAQIDFEIYSHTGDQNVIHCQGRALWAPQPEPSRIDVGHLEQEMSQGQLDPQGVYAAFAGMGMHYGPAFQAITGIYRGDGQVLAHLRLPETIADKWEDYVIHPSLMDGALQACVGLIEGWLESFNQPRLPFALDSLRILSRFSREMFAWVRYAAGSQAGDEVTKLDIDLFDEQGNPCVEIAGFSHRALKIQEGVTFHRPQDAQSELRSFVSVWNPLLPEACKPAILSGSTRTLLLGAGEVQLQWLQKSQPHADLLPLPSNASVEIIEQKLQGRSFDHLLWIAPDIIRADDQTTIDEDSLIQQQEAGVLLVFRVIKALLRLGYGDKELRWTIITAKTQRVKKDERVRPAHAAIFGLIGSLAKEYPHWKLSLLDVDSLESLTADECLSMPPDELGNGLAHRDNEWFGQEFIQGKTLQAFAPIFYRQKGVYVVIGGAGGLGEAWTRFMMENYQAKVVWIGRRKYDASIEERINALSQIGSVPLYVSADATNFDELERARKTIMERYPAIHGIVHSAVVPHDQTIARMEESQFSAGLSAKVDVSVNMDRVFGGQELDFMLFFSSVVSFVKSPAQSNYAAGCTFKDSFAQALQQQRLYPVKIINWGYWGSVGGAADEYHRKTMESMGIASIEPHEGMALLQTFVSSELDQMAAIKMIDGQAIPYVNVEVGEADTFGRQPVAPVGNGAAHSTTAQKQPADIDELLREKGIAYFQQMIASTLKMRPEQVEARRPLGEYGLDSILVGQLMFQMRKVFPNVSGTLLFEVKNIVGLVDYFVEEKKQELAKVLSVSTVAAQPSPQPHKQSVVMVEQEASAVAEKHSADIDDVLREKGIAYFQQMIASTLKMRPEQVEARRPLGEYGLDSILVGQLMFQMRKVFPNVSGTLLFEVKNIVGLVEYFVEEKKQELANVLSVSTVTPQPRSVVPRQPRTDSVRSIRRRRTGPPLLASGNNRQEKISTNAQTQPQMPLPSTPRSGAQSRSTCDVAIVGLSGRYPRSNNLKEFWGNLLNGVNCITEIPRDRWQWEDYYDPEKGKSGKIYTKWGGFMEGIDQFDPLFFKISPKEAKSMDPQERIFLESCYHAIEDAGYIPETLGNLEKIGVFVGVMNSRYAPQPAHFSVANRVSYLFNFQGPSMAVDTACSSSLTAIHLALESIYSGESACAIAGGVNLIIDPVHYFQLTEMTMLSKGNKVKAFGEHADGVVDAEGVGAVVLKPLQAAERDGDHIYAVIRSSAINAGGRTNGYTVPNPKAQARLVAQALERANIRAEDVSYIEAHGTGTALGDPIEIAGLTRAFKKTSHEKQFCSIGSLKSNIGHCESAAGIAGLTKVLLQLKYQQLVPSLHSEVPNREIDFSDTPFRVQKSLGPWQRPSREINGVMEEIPRIAGVSSFGAGGANAHLIVQEYIGPAESLKPAAVVEDTKAVIVLSARSREQVKQKAADLLGFIGGEKSSSISSDNKIDLAAVAHTLQVGRESMEERLGLVVSSAEQLTQKLEAYVTGESVMEDVYQGQVKRGQEALTLFGSDDDLKQTIDKWIANRKLSKLLELWVKGLEVDWSKLYAGEKPKRMSLPTYPFAKERYWKDSVEGKQASPGSAGTDVLHPLLHRNTSDLNEQRYSSTFTGEEFFLADHQVMTNGSGSEKVLPGVAYLEMARAAMEQAWRERREVTALELRNVVWAQPLVVNANKQINIALWANNDQVDYQIYSQDENEEIIHCQGLAEWSKRVEPARLNIEQLKREMGQGKLERESVYVAWAQMGAIYGPAFQGIAVLYVGKRQALAQLRMPIVSENKQEGYVLHPGMMDGALQAAIGLIEPGFESSQARVPFALERLSVVAPCTAEMFAWMRYAPGSQPEDKVVKLDIDLCDEHGGVCVQMRGLSSRALARDNIIATKARTNGSLLAIPSWNTEGSDTSYDDIKPVYTEHNIILCELQEIAIEKLLSSLPDSQCLSLLAGEEKNIAERYSEYALACFKRIQTVLQSKPEGKVLFQVAVGGGPQHSVLAGLWGLLKTATLENPQLTVQLLLVAPNVTSEELTGQLQAEMRRPSDRLVRYEKGERQVLRWEEISARVEQAPGAFKDQGVYLITGGLGGLGLVFAKEILKQSGQAKVVLTGRSTLSEEKRSQLEEMELSADKSSTSAGRVSYRQMDLSDLDQVKQLISSVTEEHGQIKGVLHSAGMIADNFILKKSKGEFSEVLGPKVTGTYNLDQATQEVELDFFALFSSIAGAMGNVGQADYAAANGFMDQFARYRNGQVTAKQRHGVTRSINWGAWQAGGMGTDAANWEMLQEATGMQAMQTSTGMEAFYRSLILPCDQILVAEGDLQRMRLALTAGPAITSVTFASPLVISVPQEKSPMTSEIDSGSLVEKTQDYLRKQLSELLQLPSHKIDPHAALENYGIDSILAMKLTNKLERTFGSLSKTLFFEYQTIAGLAGYFVKAHPSLVREQIGFLHEPPKAKISDPDVPENRLPTPTVRSRKRLSGVNPSDRQEIAIVGLAGRYPQAANLQEFWKNLQNGRDSITEIPSERWDHTLYYDPDRSKLGKSYSKWGGFIADADKFDPLFFNISPKEAALTDPQERLFLETAWETVEDAGYTKESISGSRVGVFVGVMWGQYELYGAEAMLSGNTALPNSSYASIANRVSYFFDFHGPSIALDTMCSSSLTAIHLACAALRNGEIDAAIAGGVNLTVHPSKYVSMSQGKFAASDGKCRSFGQGGDGYVPGEGVGAVLLKPLDSALRDGDQIYAVVKSSALNHGGKTNGYTVPNPNAQGDLILDAFKRAHIDPRTLGYIETHGTGTSLGDPIEITGLLKAFEGATDEKQFCPIGSVKSNIGHLESAAGIAAVTKALLQIKYKQLVPSLHADPPNPNINFQDSPFYVQTELAEWKHTAAHPRRVGVSSFGAGGSNAHLILEEYAGAREGESGSPATQREVFVLSAKDQDALGRYAERVVNFLQNTSDVSLADIAFTSQVGRTAMDARLAIITWSRKDLTEKLKQWLTLRENKSIRPAGNAPELEDVFHGSVRDARHNAVNLIEGRAGNAFLSDLLASADVEKLARFWVLGVEVNWRLLGRVATPKRVSLPTYPFDRERCWVETSPKASSARAIQKKVLSAPKAITVVHAEERKRTYYDPQWILRPISGAEEKRPAIGPILILDRSEELFLSMRETGKNGLVDDRIVLVKPGKSFEEIAPNIFVIDTEREEHFQELIENLRNRALLPALVLQHCSDACNLEARYEVTQYLQDGVYALLYLSKALMKERLQGALRYVSVFSSHSDATAPLGAAMGGFFKTLVMENPRYLAKVVEIQGGSGRDGVRTISEKVDLIWQEIYEKEWTANEIRYGNRTHENQQKPERYVSELLPQTGVQNESAHLPLRKNGVYLITGGLGGLGLVFAEYLAKNFKARLVLVGRSAPSAAQEERLSQLRAYGAETLVLQADVSQLEEVERVVQEAKARFSEINGVIHAAGVNRDSFIFKKTRAEMEAVLASKIYGAINLDLATKDESMDLFVLFSSIAGVMGNPGQSDYAFANHFLDSFVESRENLKKTQTRTGRTLSINWPLWEEGGMNVSPELIALAEKQTGICPLPTKEGIRYWEDFLRSGELQGVALYGIPSRIAKAIAQKAVSGDKNVTAPVVNVDVAMLLAKTEEYLKALIGDEIKLAPDRIGSTDRLESYGIDSVMINQLNINLEKDLGALPKTLLYEHETVQDLAQFLLQESLEALVMLFALTGSLGKTGILSTENEEETVQDETPLVEAEGSDESGPIAIIGIHGRYPHSANLAEYWENLKHGRDLIDLVPASRWDYKEFYHPDPAAALDGKIYCKWGGFLDDYDKFDPRFFNIAVEEAKVMDPQERMFLESVWAAVEDAGYTRDSLKRRFPKGKSADVGVFVGVTTNSYHLWAPEERNRGNIVFPSALPWSIANRVSYFFDFSGPSLPVDTACSSSLVAVHLACESLKRGECQVAIAGGVNLYLHPSKYQSLCQRRMLSLDGKCHSYGAGDDGFVPGEGIGTLVLKSLSKAIDDHDHIYSVIAASAFDHSGRSNGYSAPNPNSQANLISQTLNKAQIHPETISYVEGHGTGTQLGDGIEIAALTNAFRKQTTKTQFCPIGSVKANVGHSESAAGMAGMAKVILQMKYRQLAPSIYSDDVNANIEFKESPFYLQHGLSEWQSSPAHPRRALVNSFGAGGVNACVVLEEYQDPNAVEFPKTAGPYLFTLSAKDEDRLREYANRLLVLLRREKEIDLGDLCYTLQIGREALEERLATVVADVDELIDRLDVWIRVGPSAHVDRGSLGPRGRSKRLLGIVKTGSHTLAEIASRWAAGEEVHWESLWTSSSPCRMSLPAYPFARERYWISNSQAPENRVLPNTQLHPLISYNSSTLKEVSFASSLSDTAFYSVDHKVNEEGIFPGAGFLEIACISGNIAAERRVRKIKDIVWVQPLRFRKGPQTVRTVLKNVGETVEYVISSLDEENEEVLHSEGKLTFQSSWTDQTDIAEQISIEVLKAQCKRPDDVAAYYDKFRKYGVHYGPSFQTIQEIYISDSFALSKLKIADCLKGDFGQFILHPSMIDGALQTAASLVGGMASATPHLPFALDEVEMLHPVRQTCYAYAEFADSRERTHTGVRKFNIRLLNESGDVLINFRNLFVRAIPTIQTGARSTGTARLSAAAGD